MSRGLHPLKGGGRGQICGGVLPPPRLSHPFCPPPLPLPLPFFSPPTTLHADNCAVANALPASGRAILPQVPASVAKHVVFVSGINQLLDHGGGRSSTRLSTDLWTGSSNDGSMHGSIAGDVAASTTAPPTTTAASSSSMHSRSYHLQKCPKKGKRHIQCIGAQTMVALETIRKVYNVTIRGSPLIAQAAAEFHGNFHVEAGDLGTFGKLNGLGLLEPLKVNRREGVPDPGPQVTRSVVTALGVPAATRQMLSKAVQCCATSCLFARPFTFSSSSLTRS